MAVWPMFDIPLISGIIGCTLGCALGYYYGTRNGTLNPVTAERINVAQAVLLKAVSREVDDGTQQQIVDRANELAESEYQMDEYEFSLDGGHKR